MRESKAGFGLTPVLVAGAECILDRSAFLRKSRQPDCEAPVTAGYDETIGAALETADRVYSAAKEEGP